MRLLYVQVWTNGDTDDEVLGMVVRTGMRSVYDPVSDSAMHLEPTSCFRRTAALSGLT